LQPACCHQLIFNELLPCRYLSLLVGSSQQVEKTAIAWKTL
jgi:hypothetical protein